MQKVYGPFSLIYQPALIMFHFLALPHIDTRTRYSSQESFTSGRHSSIDPTATMSSLLKRNDALIKNGFTNTSFTNNHITVRGSDWYFTVCAVMAVSSFVFAGLAYTKPRSQRLFHYITAGITFVATIAYFCMGANLGWTAIQVEFERSNPKVSGNMRQIFYVRYIDWFITTPLLLADLLLTCGLPTPTIFYTILMNEIMVVTGLVGALVKSSYKWGFFTFGCVAFFFVAYTVVFEGRAYARSLGNDIAKVYTICGVWTIGLWCLYPIAWGVSEGGNVIPSDSEAIFYGKFFPRFRASLESVNPCDTFRALLPNTIC